MGKTEKGILSKIVEEKIKVAADDAIKAPAALEWADGLLIGGAITVIDDHFAAKYIPEDIAADIRVVVDKLIVEEDPSVAAILATDIQLKYLNVPGFDDELEKRIVSGMLELAFGLILKYISEGPAT